MNLLEEYQQMNKRIGFIGCGKMAQAMIAGLLSSNLLQPERIMISAKSEATVEKVKTKYSVLTANRNKDVAEWADFLFLAVKPDQHTEIINEIKEIISDNTIIITIAAGISLSALEGEFGKSIKAVRSMPNTPSLVGEGMSALSVNPSITNEEMSEVIAIFESFGKVELLPEALMDSVPAISGSSPAYVYLFIEALADGGVKAGLPRDQAYRLGAQAVLGAAKMVLETEMHPGELKDQVCTPGGATIEAISSLEQNGFRGAILQAMESCYKKTKNL